MRSGCPVSRARGSCLKCSTNVTENCRRFFFCNERLLNLLSLLLRDILLLSCLHQHSWNALTVTAKSNHSREKGFAHGKSNSFTARTHWLTAKANQLRMRYFYSGGHSVLEVLLFFTAGHRYHHMFSIDTRDFKIRHNGWRLRLDGARGPG